MKLKPVTVVMLCWLTISCSMLPDLLMSSLSPAKGGINTELVVGDKEQVLGANQDVKATSVGKVVGNSDNSTAITSAQEVEVYNINYPGWLVLLLLFTNFLFLCMPTPTRTWKALMKWINNKGTINER